MRLLLVIIFSLISATSFAANLCQNSAGFCTTFSAGGYNCQCDDQSRSSYDPTQVDAISGATVLDSRDCEKILRIECPEEILSAETECTASQLANCQNLHKEYQSCNAEMADASENALVKCCFDHSYFEGQILWLLDCMEKYSCDDQVNVCFELSSCNSDGNEDNCTLDPEVELREMYRNSDIAQTLDSSSGCSAINNKYSYIFSFLLISLIIIRRKYSIRL